MVRRAKINYAEFCTCCQRPGVYCKTLCRSCYNRLQIHGDPRPRTQFKPSFQDLFWSKVDKDSRSSDCWLWTGPLTTKGYGHMSHCPKPYTSVVHRTAWKMLVGPLADDVQLDHRCLDKRCVNPDHLEPVSNAVNSQHAKEYRTHCRRGHPYDADNTYFEGGSGRRGCRTCRRASIVSFHQRNPNYYAAKSAR